MASGRYRGGKARTRAALRLCWNGEDGIYNADDNQRGERLRYAHLTPIRSDVVHLTRADKERGT